MSQLIKIINRLQLMKENSHEGEIPQRYFEINGEKKCSVKYFNKNNTFELEVYEKSGKTETYQFDNIDMIAIEIMDIIQH